MNKKVLMSESPSLIISDVLLFLAEFVDALAMIVKKAAKRRPLRTLD
jgi:hypothetical protein